MPWYFPWSESIKKRACRYLLQHYLGRFLETKLGLDQLSVNLYKGMGSVKDVALDVDALNELGEEHGFPFEFLDGSIEEVSVMIPWAALLKESSFVEIKGLYLVIHPKHQCKNSFMLESMINSMTMTTSMQLAEECLKQKGDESEEDVSQASTFEGLELFAKTLETVLARVKIRFMDIVLRVEYVPRSSSIGVGLQIHIKRIDYYDLAGVDQDSPKGDQDINEKAAYSTKKFFLEGITLHTDEFPSAERTLSRSCSSTADTATSEMVNEEVVHKNLGPSSLVLCGKLSGRHEITVRLKQWENIPGPKIELDLQLGSSIILLSPRQWHAFHAIFQSLVKPTLDMNVKLRRTEKPMQPADYQRIESELQQQMKQASLGGMTHGEPLSRKGWSAGYFDDSDEEFHPFGTVPPGEKSSDDISPPGTKSPSPIGLEHVSVESPFNHTQRNLTKKSSGKSIGLSGTDDSVIRKMRFSSKLGSLVFVLLHEDILAANSITSNLAASTVQEMRNFADNFFSHVGLLSLSGARIKDLSAVKEKLDTACSRSHLRFVFAPIAITGSEYSSAAGSGLELQLSVAAMEAIECLLEKSSPAPSSEFEYCHLISFLPPTDSGAQIKPSMTIKVNSLEPCPGRQKVRNPIKPEMHINIQLNPCDLELDISIIDRITALLNSPTFLNTSAYKSQFSNMYQEKQPTVDEMLDDGTGCCTHLAISSLLANIKLRFPIPDLRPVHDLQRSPWWRRCVRPDVLTVELQEACLTTVFVPNETVITFQLVCKEAKGLYQENSSETPLLFLHATAQDGDCVNIDDGAGNYDLPRLIFTLRPSQTNTELEEGESNEDDDADVMHLSTGEALLGLTASEPSPFSRKARMHKGNKDDNSEAEELLTPGSAEEIAEFIAFASKNCLRQFDISLPKLSLILPSKHFFEVLYNRLSTDLCLWEPSAPDYFTSKNSTNFEFKTSSYKGLGSTVLQSPIPGMFIMCKSGILYESDSESDDGESNHFSYLKNRDWNKSTHLKDRPSKMCISLNIGKGSGTLFSLIRDAGGTVSATHHGEIQCSIDNGTFFSITSFQGESNTGYVCFQASKASLSHNGYIFNSCDEVLGTPKKAVHHSSRVDRVIYPSSNESGVNISSESGSMISLALKIHLDERSHVKTFKTAVSVKGGTLRHRFTPMWQSWYSQVLDFFDVVDYPISGYRSPTVITELHFNLSSCAIDYRPLYLPARVLITIGSLNVSSNIIAQTSCSVLRFVIEDAALHLSNVVGFGTVNLTRDFVCVMDVDLLELSLRLHNPPGDEPWERKFPKIDLQTSINMVQLRTCVDSFRLLLDLLTYLAEDGDLDEKGISYSENSSDSGMTLKNCSGQDSLQTDCVSPAVEEVEAHVNGLMAEAMLEASPTNAKQKVVYRPQPKEEPLPSPTEVFFFPDENFAKPPPSTSEVDISNKHHEPLGIFQEGMESLMDDALDPSCDERPEQEEEFCILENDPGVGFTPRGGEPQVRNLLGASIQLIEGHFAPPISKTDVLKAPKNFPMPVVRYTLNEMTLIWHIFGGQDFPKKGTQLPNRSLPFSNNTGVANTTSKVTQTVTFSKADLKEDVTIQYTAGKRSMNYLSATPSQKYNEGGAGRQQDVKLEFQLNKVRFQHETYPDHTVQAARQALIISEFEIRDRLASSHINKFLYQYCSEARPRQAHANMVVVKALHVRPDNHVPTVECCLKVSILPLRLHIDQDTLFFISEFFTSLAESGTERILEEENSKNTPAHPVMGVGGETLSMIPNGRSSTEIFVQDLNSNPDLVDTPVTPPTYFRSFIFSPDVLIRFDYHGKRVDLSQGPLAGLLVGLGQLNCSQLVLKRLSHRHGLLGTNKLIAFALNEWLLDIRKNQLPSVLSGVGPMHSIVQLFQGVRDLFWLPIEQFQKDGRIVRGIQRGANAFSTSAAYAILELTSRMIQTLQSAAETAYDVVSPGPSVKRQRPWSRGRRRRYSQPADIRDGVTKAYQVVKEGLGETAKTLVRVASEEAEQKGVTGAVGGVLRQIPPTVVKPIILATEATVNVLGGVQSQLMPDTRKEAIDKWRQEE